MGDLNLKGVEALGQGVAYTDTNGRLKAAIIVAVPETIHPDGSLSLADGQVMLAVFSMKGSGNYSRRATLNEDGTFHRTSEGSIAGDDYDDGETGLVDTDEDDD